MYWCNFVILSLNHFFPHLLYYNYFSSECVILFTLLFLLYVLLVYVNVVIIIYLGGIYSSHLSSKKWTQRCCFYFSRERSQSKLCKQSKCSCAYVILEKLYNWRYNVSLFPQSQPLVLFTNVMKFEFLKKYTKFYED